MLNYLFCSHNSQMKADINKGMGTYCIILHSGLRITFGMDKDYDLDQMI
jgi:hypothetical protein